MPGCFPTMFPYRSYKLYAISYTLLQEPPALARELILDGLDFWRDRKWLAEKKRCQEAFPPVTLFHRDELFILRSKLQVHRWQQ